MGTSVLHFKGRGIWLHHAVAEVWLAELIGLMAAERGAAGSLATLLVEMEQALKHNWVTGVLVSGFDEHVQDEDAFAALAPLLHSTKTALLALPADERRVVTRLGRPVHVEFLRAELRMIEDLFFHPERVAAPPACFGLRGEPS